MFDEATAYIESAAVFEQEGLLASVESIYLNFLAAIARRDINGVLACGTEDFRAQLREMSVLESDEPALDLWCEQYPSTVTFECLEIGHITAMLHVSGTVAGERVDANIGLKRMADGWRIDREIFVAAGSDT